MRARRRSDLVEPVPGLVAERRPRRHNEQRDRAADGGYQSVEQVPGRVRVSSSGGTELQPRVDLPERATDYPTDAPILVITNGHCDVVRIGRGHTFPIPEAAAYHSAPRAGLPPPRTAAASRRTAGQA